MPTLGNVRTVALLVALLFAPAASRAVTLDALLAATAANARFPLRTRAGLRIEPPQGPPVDLALLCWRDTVRIEQPEAARALIRHGKVLVPDGQTVRRAAPGQTVPGTDVALADLAIFTTRTLATPQISDEGPDGVVVTGAPAGPSPWVLVVRTIDPERHVVTKTQYYRDRVNNMVAIRRDDGFTQFEDHWRPGTGTIDHLDGQPPTRLTFTFLAGGDVARTSFRPAGLPVQPRRAVSPLVPR
jgi:hypothetical protein